jgi:hypothetical protein
MGQTHDLKILEDGNAVVDLQGGEVKVVRFPPDEAENPSNKIGLDLLLPSGLLPDQCRDMISSCLELGTDLEMTVFDPQMGRTVSHADIETIFQHWQDQNAYLLRTVGSNGSVAGGGAHYPEYKGGLSASAIFWLAVGGLLVAVFLLARFCT